MWWFPKEPFLIASLLQWELFSYVFQQLLQCTVFSKIPEPDELIQVAGYVFIPGTTHPFQILLDQSLHTFDGIGQCHCQGQQSSWSDSAGWVVCMEWIDLRRWPVPGQICVVIRRWTCHSLVWLGRAAPSAILSPLLQIPTDLSRLSLSCTFSWHQTSSHLFPWFSLSL